MFGLLSKLSLRLRHLLRKASSSSTNSGRLGARLTMCWVSGRMGVKVLLTFWFSSLLLSFCNCFTILTAFSLITCSAFVNSIDGLKTFSSVTDSKSENVLNRWKSIPMNCMTSIIPKNMTKLNPITSIRITSSHLKYRNV